jgi:hypothetical protein
MLQCGPTSEWVNASYNITMGTVDCSGLSQREGWASLANVGQFLRDGVGIGKRSNFREENV